MFVLHPGGKSGGGLGGVGSSETRQKAWFFGKLGLYFVAIRMAFVFMSGRIEGGEPSTSSSSTTTASTSS